MSTAKPKLKFKPRRMQASVYGVGMETTVLRSKRHPTFACPVLVLPADPESVEALVDKASLAIKLATHGDMYASNETVARAVLAALGFKTKGQK